MADVKLKVTGMHCEGCENKIRKMLPRIDSVDNVKADRNAELVEFTFNGNEDTLIAVKDKIADLGYEVVE
ncbi:MAG TPA: heavy-metal-associated domain-containing protein [Balneolales bacterium]|nr:heavy-metal-associated domain-containing protein [Balneolales bacterium]